MRRVIFQVMVSIDGYFEGKNREIDWHNVDDEYNKYSTELLNSIDTLVMGRITYELMSKYWPSQSAIKNEPHVAERMNNIQKLVFSNTLEKVEWKNAKLFRANIADEIARQKLRQCKDLAIFGSSALALCLIPSGLINEYRTIVNPVVIGTGKTLFTGIDSRLRLKLLYTKTFRSGNVLICYMPLTKGLTQSSFLGDMIN
jgi:dihydrofolate reductase